MEDQKLKMFMNKLDGHDNPVLCSILFPHSVIREYSQKYLITGSSSNITIHTRDETLVGEFRIWDLETGACKNKRQGHNKAISALAVIASRNDDYLITGSEDGSIIIWKYDAPFTFELLHCFENYHKQDITSIAVYIPPTSNDYDDYNTGLLFVSASLDRITLVWDFYKIIQGSVERCSKELGDDFEFYRPQKINRDISEVLKPKPKNKNKMTNRVIPTNEDEEDSLNKAIYIKEENDGKKIRTDIFDEEKHTDGILSIAIYIPKNNCIGKCDNCECKPLIVTGSWDTSIIIWDLKKNKFVKKLKGHTKAVNSIFIFDPHPTYPDDNVNYYKSNLGPGGSSPILVTGSMDTTIIIWDLLEGIKINELRIKTEVFNNKIENSEFTFKSDDASNKSFKLISKNNKIIESGRSAVIKSTIFVFDASSEQNRPQIVSCDNNSHIILWDLLSGNIINKINYSDYFPGTHSIDITSVIAYVSEDGFRLISCSKSDSANLVFWDFSTIRKPYKREKNHNNITILKIYDPKDSTNNPISIVADIEGIIEVWDIIQHKKLLEFDKHSSRINYLAIHPVSPESGNTENSYQLYVAACDGNNNIVLRKIKVFNDKVEEIIESRRIIVMKYFFYTIDFISVPHLVGDSISLYLVKGRGSYRNDSTKFWNIGNILNSESNPNKNFLNDESTMNPDLVLDPFDDHSNLVRCIISYKPSDPNEKKLFMVTSSYDKTVIVWEIAINSQRNLSCSKVRTLIGHNDKVFTICIFREYIITGGFDAKVIIWSKLTGEAIKELTDNPDSVTCIDVLDSSDSIPTPLLITSGIGKLILLFELNPIDEKSIKETKKVKTLVRHEDRVCSLAVYNPTSDSIILEPILVSGGDDNAFMVWKDCFQISKTMPNQTIVQDAFKFDLESEFGWPLMRDLTKTYEIALWIDNCDLFYDVIVKLTKAKRLDKIPKILEFFNSFKPEITKTIRYTNKYKSPYKAFSKEYKTLLRCAIDIVDNNQVVQIILDCLLENINKDINDPLTQRLYHPSYFVGYEDILFLGKKYPSLFIYFISKIKLIKSSHILNKSFTKLNIYDPSRIIISSSPYNWKTDLWKCNILERRVDNYVRNNYFNSKETESQVTSYYLPLVNSASREMLNAFVDISYKKDNVDIFNGDVGEIVIKYLWEKTFPSLLSQLFIYLFYVVLYSYLVYKYENLMQNANARGHDIAKALNWVLFFLTIYYCQIEFVKVYIEHNDNRNFNYHITEKNKKWFIIDAKFWVTGFERVFTIWSLIDTSMVILVITGTVMRINSYSNVNSPTYQPSHSPHINVTTNYPTSFPTMNNTVNYPESNTLRIINAIATLLVYFKVFYFLRILHSFPLVSLVMKVFKEITAILVIVLIMVCAFAQVFWLLNENNASLKFGSSIWHSYLYTFLYMMGQNVDPDNDFKSPLSYTLAVLILAMFMLLMTLFMLNFFIAVMNDSYQVFREKVFEQWRLEQGWTMLEDIWTCRVKVDPFLYVLKYTSEIGSENDIKLENFNNSINNNGSLSLPLKDSAKNLFNNNNDGVTDEKLDKLFKLVEFGNKKLNELEESIKSIKMNNASSALQNQIPKYDIITPGVIIKESNKTIEEKSDIQYGSMENIEENKNVFKLVNKQFNESNKSIKINSALNGLQSQMPKSSFKK